MKQIIITGASGFVGSFLVEKALKLNFKTWAAIRHTSSKEYLKDKSINFIDFDYSDVDRLTQQFLAFKKENGRIDYFIHNAGITKSIDISDFETINYQYTVNLIDALIAADCIPKKFILISSLSAFGMGDEVNYTPIRLDDIPKPNTAYGLSKLRAEEYLQQKISFPYIILRPTGVYGPREKDYFLMLKTVQAGFDVGAGFKPQHLTFIYVKDLVDVVFLATESNLVNKAYFVADGDVYTDKEYTALVKKILNKKRVLSIKIPLFVLKIVSIVAEGISKLTKKPSTLNRDKYKIMKQRNWECDIEPTKKELGFEPKYNLEKGLDESVKWYKNNNWL